MGGYVTVIFKHSFDASVCLKLITVSLISGVGIFVLLFYTKHVRMFNYTAPVS
jgi:hypothetical protein